MELLGQQSPQHGIESTSYVGVVASIAEKYLGNDFQRDFGDDCLGPKLPCSV